jgi:ABC-type uncharacterized transport system substrate-binding protein
MTFHFSSQNLCVALADAFPHPNADDCAHSCDDSLTDQAIGCDAEQACQQAAGYGPDDADEQVDQEACCRLIM